MRTLPALEKRLAGDARAALDELADMVARNLARTTPQSFDTLKPLARQLVQFFDGDTAKAGAALLTAIEEAAASGHQTPDIDFVFARYG